MLPVYYHFIVHAVKTELITTKVIMELLEER
jgi:hypothetical protein